MPQPIAATVTDDDGSQPIVPLTQEFIVPVPSPPPLPPPENRPRLDLDPNLSPHQQDASPASDTSLPPSQLTVANASPTGGAGDAGWEQSFSCKTQHSHCIQVNSNNYIFQMPQFDGMTCFKISHHKSTAGL